MYFTTLLTDPAAPSLDPALVESLRNAWGGGDAVWLSPDEAAEFPLNSVPSNQWSVWSDLQGMNIDLVIRPAGDRKKKMLLADMDSTMIRQECIDELAEVAGVGDQVREITARAMNGELDFEGALTERVGLLAGLDAGVIQRVIEDRIQFTPGGETLVNTMKANGTYTVLVSGGFTSFTEYVATTLGFDENRANTLIIEDGKLSGHVAHPILGREAKIKALKEISAKLGVAYTDVMAVGDGANDLGMLELAGAGVALHAKPSVAVQCDIRINFGDLTALLYIQGYAREDFAETS